MYLSSQPLYHYRLSKTELKELTIHQFLARSGIFMN